MFQIVYSGYWLRVSSDQNPIPKRVGKRSMCTQSTHLAPPPHAINKVPAWLQITEAYSPFHLRYKMKDLLPLSCSIPRKRCIVLYARHLSSFVLLHHEFPMLSLDPEQTL